MAGYDANRARAYAQIVRAAKGLVCDIGADTNIPCVITEFEFQDRDSDLIGRQDKKVIIPAEGLSIVPNTSDHTITFKSGSIIPPNVAIRIAGVVAVGPDNSPIIYELQIRL